MWYIISRTAGKYATSLANHLGITRLRINRRGLASLGDHSPKIICYGFAGDLAGEWFANIHKVFPARADMRVVNRYIVANKYTALRHVSLPKPTSKLKLGPEDNPADWIMKRQYSMCGRGIVRAESRERVPGMYFQKFIDNRPYEIRVHAFTWIPKEEWWVDKRVGEADQLAWNHARGGKFIEVRDPARFPIFQRARQMAEKALDDLEMDFGAVDFVLDKDKNIYFLEVNAAPGWTNRTEGYYFDTFRRLINENGH